MFSQKESAGIRSRIRTCWLCCSAPQCSARTKSSTFRGREHSTGKQAKYFCVKLLSESPAQKSNSCGGRVGELPGQARCGKISCCAPRQIIPQLSIVLSAWTAAVCGECQLLGASSPCVSHMRWRPGKHLPNKLLLLQGREQAGKRLFSDPSNILPPKSTRRGRISKCFQEPRRQMHVGNLWRRWIAGSISKRPTTALLQKNQLQNEVMTLQYSPICWHKSSAFHLAIYQCSIRRP